MDAVNISHLKQLICEVGRLMYERGYVVSNDGNIALRVGADELIITPSGVGKGRMTPELLVHCGMDGTIISGARKPSSEIAMHLALLQNRPDVAASLHAHPPYCTAFAACRRPIAKRYLPELLVSLGEVPAAPFALPSTREVPESILPFVSGHAVLLSNHGVLVWGGGLPGGYWGKKNACALLEADLWRAFDRLEVAEYAARIEITVDGMGGGVALTDEEAGRILALRGFYADRARPLTREEKR